MATITLENGPFGFYILRSSTGRTLLVQSDYDYPGIAADFGWRPCCSATDGTVDCAHKSATQHIGEASDFLADHIGETVEDPGYFITESNAHEVSITPFHK